MRNDPRPRVSVIIPFHDRGQYLDDAVTSCVEAYSGPLEILLVDDGSTDPRTARDVASLSVPDRAELKILRQQNAGPARARNLGLARCTGEYVQFLDSDDLLVRNKIEHQLHHLALNPGADASVCDYWTCDDTRFSFHAPPSSIAPFALSLEDFLFRWERGFTIPIHAALFRRKVLCGSPPWPDVVGRTMKDDWLFWVRLALRDLRLAYLPLRLCIYRLHGSNMTRSWSAMGLQWLKASAEIERWLGGRYPHFVEQSVRWYVDFYVDRAAREPSSSPTEPPRPPPSTRRRPAARRAPRAVDDAVRTAGASMSVVIPVFNHASYLRRAILSATAQTVPPGEVIVVDDGSSDPAVRPILEQLAAEDPRVRLFFLPENRGIAHAQNHAVERARGEYVAFLDCDDFLPPNSIQAVATEIVEGPDADYFFTDRWEIDSDDRVLREAVYGGYPEPNDLDGVSHHENLLDAMIASHLKVVRRSKILAVGGFDPRTSGVQDWDLALKISAIGKLHYVPEPLYCHRVHAQSVTLGRRVEMFRLTNEVRRRHQAIRARKDVLLPPGLSELPSLAALLARDAGAVPPCVDSSLRWDAAQCAWIDDAAQVAIVRAPRRPRDAFALWSGVRAAVFALERDASAETIAFLREFNSYFDLVVCADEAQWTALHRFVWDARVLRLRDELLPPRATIAQRCEVVAPT